jgi:hypothetical protein
LMARIAFTRSCAENRRAVRYDTLLRARTAGAYGHRRFHSGVPALDKHTGAYAENIGKSSEFLRQDSPGSRSEGSACGERDDEGIGADALRGIRPAWLRRLAPLAISGRVRNCPKRADSGRARRAYRPARDGTVLYGA